jgi:hypothetical protein
MPEIMSYKTMEAMLVEKVRQLRQTEAELMRSYAEVQSNPCSATTIALNLGFDHVDQQLCAIEQLMAEMDRVNHANVAFVPAVNSALMTPAFQV